MRHSRHMGRKCCLNFHNCYCFFFSLISNAFISLQHLFINRLLTFNRRWACANCAFIYFLTILRTLPCAPRNKKTICTLLCCCNFHNCASCGSCILKACFHYERGMEHSLFLLLVCPCLKFKQKLSKAKKSIKQTKLLSTFVMETSPQLRVPNSAFNLLFIS